MPKTVPQLRSISPRPLAALLMIGMRAYRREAYAEMPGFGLHYDVCILQRCLRLIKVTASELAVGSGLVVGDVTIVHVMSSMAREGTQLAYKFNAPCFVITDACNY
jgi:hypothetical protein